MKAMVSRAFGGRARQTSPPAISSSGSQGDTGSDQENSQNKQTAPVSLHAKASAAASRSAPIASNMEHSIARKAPSSRAKKSSTQSQPQPLSDSDEAADITNSRKTAKKTLAKLVAPAPKKRKTQAPDSDEDAIEQSDKEEEAAPVTKSQSKSKQPASDNWIQRDPVQLLPVQKGQTGEVLDIYVGDGVLVNGKVGDHGKANSYDDNPAMPYWIGTVLKIHRSKNTDGRENTDGDLDQKATLEIRWYFNQEETRLWGLNMPKVQLEHPYFGNKEIQWSDYTQSKPAVPVGAICGKCTILKFSDDARESGSPLTLITEGVDSMESQGVDVDALESQPADLDDALLAGAGSWKDDEHIFYYRTGFFGLGKNWRRNLSRFEESTLKDTDRPYRLTRLCTCRKPYSPDEFMRQCASEKCEGKWYHFQCIEAGQEDVDRDLESSRIEGLPAHRPSAVVRALLPLATLTDMGQPEDLWAWVQAPVVRGGSHGLIGNTPVVYAARQLVRAYLSQKTRSLSNWREAIREREWELLQASTSRFAGKSAKLARAVEQRMMDGEWYCPECGVSI